MKRHFLTIEKNEEIAKQIYSLTLSGQYALDEFIPGKFLHIKCNPGVHPLLRRPMSICDIDDFGKKMRVIYRASGEGTRILSKRKTQETLDVLAPLGQGFAFKEHKNQTIYLVGGGIGIPPLYYLGRLLKKNNNKVISFLGFSSKKEIFLLDEFKSLGESHVSTVDGSHGHQGFITDLLNNNFDALFSCGPVAMFKTLQKIIPKEKIAYLSMEERMGCGIGACLACVCRTENGYARACSEGPVFNLHELVLTL